MIEESRSLGGSILGSLGGVRPANLRHGVRGARLWRVAQNPDAIRVRDEIENRGASTNALMNRRMVGTMWRQKTAAYAIGAGDALGFRRANPGDLVLVNA